MKRIWIGLAGLFLAACGVVAADSNGGGYGCDKVASIDGYGGGHPTTTEKDHHPTTTEKDCEHPTTTIKYDTTTTKPEQPTTTFHVTTTIGGGGTTTTTCPDCVPNTQGVTTTTSTTLPGGGGTTTTVPTGTTTSTSTTTTTVKPPVGTTTTTPPGQTTTTTLPATFAFGAAATVCRAEVPTIVINFQNTFPQLAGHVGTLTMADVNGNVVSTQSLTYQPNTTVELLYPGTRVNADGSIADVPGWNLTNAGLWVRDPSDEFLREGIRLTYTVNPTATAFVTYPPESSACANPENTTTTTTVPHTIPVTK